MQFQKFEFASQDVDNNAELNTQIITDEASVKQLLLSYFEKNQNHVSDFIKLTIGIMPWVLSHSQQKYLPFSELEFCRDMIKGLKIANPQQNLNINAFIKLLDERNKYLRFYLELLCIMVSQDADTAEDFLFLEDQFYAFRFEIKTLIKLLNAMQSIGRGKNDKRFKSLVSILTDFKKEGRLNAPISAVDNYDDTLEFDLASALNALKINNKLYTINKHSMPFVLHTIFSDDIGSFHEFYEAYQHSVNRVSEENTVTFNTFIIAYSKKLINLYQVMGKNCFPFLKELAKSSIISLINFFAAYTLIPKEYIEIFTEFCIKFIANESYSIQETLMLKLGLVASFYKLETTSFNPLINLKSYLNQVSAANVSVQFDHVISTYYANQFNIINQSDLKLFQDFYRTFVLANNRADDNYRLSFSLFINAHQKKLLNLYEMLGVSAFTFLKSLIATSVIALNRFLISYTNINSNLYVYGKFIYEKMNDASHQEKESFFKIMSQISQFYQEFFEIEAIFFTDVSAKDDASNKNSLSDAIIQMLNGLIGSINETQHDNSTILTKLKRLLSSFYCHYLELPINQDTVDSIVNKYQGSQLHQLCEGRKAMKADAYEEIFYELIKFDILKQQTFYDFVLNNKQASAVAKKIAEHNLDILKLLKKLGIKTDLLLDYKHSVSFVDNANSTDSFINILFALWNDVTQLKDAIQSLTKETKLSELDELIRNFRAQILKANSNNEVSEKDLKALNQIFQPGQLTWLTRIVKKFSEIKNSIYQIRGNNLAKDERYFIEWGDHLVDRLTILKNQMLNKVDKIKKTNLKVVKHYRAEVWDKSRYDTIFLGNKVRCCLSSDGAHHYAIYQRRVDIAMQIPVVIDEASGEPVALIWGYLAYDKNDPEKILFVANFIEMIASIAMKPELRTLVLNHLLGFAAKYAKDLGAKEFIVRHLKYGVIPDADLKDLKDLDIKIEKVGGYLRLNENKKSDSYYLSSVKDTKFHRYPIEQVYSEIKDSKTEIQVAPISTATFFAPTVKKLEILDDTAKKEEQSMSVFGS